MRFSFLLCLFVLLAFSAPAMAQSNYDFNTSGFYVDGADIAALQFTTLDDGTKAVTLFVRDSEGIWREISTYFLDDGSNGPLWNYTNIDGNSLGAYGIDGLDPFNEIKAAPTGIPYTPLTHRAVLMATVSPTCPTATSFMGHPTGILTGSSYSNASGANEYLAFSTDSDGNFLCKRYVWHADEERFILYKTYEWNGILMGPGYDFTASDGSSMTFMVSNSGQDLDVVSGDCAGESYSYNGAAGDHARISALTAKIPPPQPQGSYDTNDYYLSSDGLSKLQFQESGGVWSVEYWKLAESGQWYLVGVYFLERPDGEWDTDDTWTGMDGDVPMGINTEGGPDTVSAHDFHGNDLGTFNRSV